jgi:hypothetical protein
MAVDDIKELKGYNKPSVYKGQKADRLIKELGIGTVEDFNKLAREQGLGSFGKDKEATKFLNKLLTDAGKDPYVVRNPIERQITNQIFGSDPVKNKTNNMVFSTRVEKVSNAVQSMKTSTKDKIAYIRNTFKQLYPGISKASLKELPKLFAATLGLPVSAGLSLAFSPSAEAAELPKKPLIDLENLDFGGPDVNKQLLEQMSQDATMIKKRGGGMMNIDEMIRPIGMAAGGPIPPEPKKENKNGFGSLLMDFIRSEGMFAPSGKKFDTSDSPMIKSESKMHPLVVFKEMYDQYRIDGGEMSFKEFFDMIQTNLNNEAST